MTTASQHFGQAPRHRADVPVDSPTKALWPFAHAPGLHRWKGADRHHWRPATDVEREAWLRNCLARARLVAGVGLMVLA